MTRDEMERDVYDEMGVATPSWPIQRRVVKALTQAHIRVVAEEKLNHARADLAFVANDPDVALPADFLEIRSLRRSGVVLREVTDPEYAALVAANSVSATLVAYDGPMVYAMKEPNRVTVFPTPTAAVTLGAELWYVAKITPMASGAASPDGIPEPWHELLVCMVLAKLGPVPLRPRWLEESRELRLALHYHVAERTGDDSYRIKLKGYPGR